MLSRHRRISTLLALGLALAVTLIGCSGEDELGPRAPSDVRSCTVEVLVSDGWRKSDASRVLTITVPPNRAPSTRIRSSTSSRIPGCARDG